MKQHFTKAAISLFTLAALTLTACEDSDDDDPDIDPIPTACVLTRMTDDAGNETKFSYNDQGYVSSITYDDRSDYDGPELVISYVYDNNNRVIRQNFTEEDADADAGYTVYTYTDNLISKSERYRDGNLIKTENFSYNASGLLERITDSDGNEKTFIYNSAGNITEMRSTEGGETFRTVYDGYDEMETPYSAVKGYLHPAAYSKNNPGNSSTYQVTNGEEVLITNSAFRYYEYNDLDQPTRIEEQQDNGFGLVINTNLTYDCD